MCSEHDSDTCHRNIVAQRLYDDYNINTKHIGRTGEIVNHINTSDRTSNVGAEHDVSRTQQVTGHKQYNVKVNGVQNYPSASVKNITAGSEPNKPKKGKSVLISVPQEGESYEVSDATSKKAHEELAKRSGGNLNAYLGNVLEYDQSRKFIQDYAIKAASQAN